jgi:hypothetical protein
VEHISTVPETDFGFPTRMGRDVSAVSRIDRGRGSPLSPNPRADLHRLEIVTQVCTAIQARYICLPPASRRNRPRKMPVTAPEYRV